jgi:hypothetical protein
MILYERFVPASLKGGATLNLYDIYYEYTKYLTEYIFINCCLCFG